MDFLYFLEKLRNPLLNQLMLAITMLGEETAFLVIALFVFWCVDKCRGYYVLGVGFLGTIANQFMKLWFRIPRPWVLDPNFTVVEGSAEAAAGYSFPSGHTQMSVGTFGALACSGRKRRTIWICAVLAVLVGFSRMYLGVHTPADVLTAAAMAVAFVLVLQPIMLGKEGKYIPWVFGVLLVLSAGLLAFVELFPFPANVDEHNLESGIKNAYTMLGCQAGALAVWFVDRKLSFSTRAVWWAQILKFVLGLLVVLAVKEGLRSPLEALFAGHMAARAVRYFLIVAAAGILWPLSFRFFEKLGTKKEAQ